MHLVNFRVERSLVNGTISLDFHTQKFILIFPYDIFEKACLSTVENDKNKKSLEFQGHTLNYCDYI